VLTPRHGSARPQRGLSIVEMMVGITIGLLVVAAASMVVSTQLADNRSLLVDTQIQQDLRATADIVTRELRRAGAWNGAAKGVWYPGGPAPLANPFAAVSPASAPATEVDYAYHRSAGAEGPFGFRLSGGVIQAKLGSSGWQELTDPRTLTVTNFTITPVSAPATPTKLPCPKLCADGSTDCWPTVTVRELVVRIAGQAAGDASIQRSIESTVRLRNDWVGFNDPLNPAQVCPA
jgi:type II secretory pathway component PulJ